MEKTTKTILALGIGALVLYLGYKAKEALAAPVKEELEIPKLPEGLTVAEQRIPFDLPGISWQRDGFAIYIPWEEILHRKSETRSEETIVPWYGVSPTYTEAELEQMRKAGYPV